jgi:uncharacterized protein
MVSPEPLQIGVTPAETVTAIVYRAPARADTTFVLAHGAGANQSHPFMIRFATALAERGIETITFNFVYSEQKRRIPDPTPKLEACYRKVIEAVRGRGDTGKLVIGGKSMGGRMASHLAAAGEDGIAGLVMLGYPLHPPGRPDKLRVAHLERITVPTLIVQGAKDSFGTPDELRPYLEQFKAPVELCVVDDADHSFKVPKRVRSQDETDRRVLDEVERWLRAL